MRNPNPRETLAEEIERHPGVAKLLLRDVTQVGPSTFAVLLEKPSEDWDSDEA